MEVWRGVEEVWKRCEQAGVQRLSAAGGSSSRPKMPSCRQCGRRCGGVEGCGGGVEEVWRTCAWTGRGAALVQVNDAVDASHRAERLGQLGGRPGLKPSWAEWGWWRTEV